MLDCSSVQYPDSRGLAQQSNSAGIRNRYFLLDNLGTCRIPNVQIVDCWVEREAQIVARFVSEYLLFFSFLYPNCELNEKRTMASEAFLSLIFSSNTQDQRDINSIILKQHFVCFDCFPSGIEGNCEKLGKLQVTV